jgi:hypothetical protein
MLLLFFVILFQPLILISVKNYCKIVDMKFSLKHLFNKISIILVEDIVLSYFLTNSDLPSINNSPIIILISIIITYMLRRIVRTYRLYQSLVHLYHPEDNHIYWLGSYYIGFYYNIVEFTIKLFICITIIELNYWNSFFYLLLQDIIEICLYYTKTMDTSNELFHITSNYIFKKLNE